MSYVRSVSSTRSWGETIAERPRQTITIMGSATETKGLSKERRKNLRSLILCKRRESFEDEYVSESIYRCKSDEAFPFFLFEEETTFSQKNSTASSRVRNNTSQHFYNPPIENSSTALYEKADKRAVKSFGFTMDDESSKESDGDNGVFSWLGLGTDKNLNESKKRDQEHNRELEWRRLLKNESRPRISPTCRDDTSLSKRFVKNDREERIEEEEESVHVGGCYASIFFMDSESSDDEENDDCEEREDVGVSSVRLSPPGYNAFREEALSIEGNNCPTTPDHEKRGWLKKLVCKSEREQGTAFLSEDALQYNAPGAYLPILSSLSQQSLDDEHSSYVESSTQSSWSTQLSSVYTRRDSRSTTNRVSRPTNDGLLPYRSMNPPRKTISPRAKTLPPLGNLHYVKKREVYGNDDEFGLMSLAPF